MGTVGLEIGRRYRVACFDHECCVTVLRKSTLRGLLWRCVTDDGAELVVGPQNVIQPIETPTQCANAAAIVCGGIYRVRRDSQNIVVEVIFPSREVSGRWIVRQFIDGPSFTIEEDDVVEAVERS